MFKKIRTVRGAVAETAAYFYDAKLHLEENKNVYIAGGCGFVVGVGVVLGFKSKPVVVNNIINLCTHTP